VLSALHLVDEPPSQVGVPANHRWRRVAHDTLGVPLPGEVIKRPLGGEVAHGGISLPDPVVKEFHEHDDLRIER
jgi:hypothetical protein